MASGAPMTFAALSLFGVCFVLALTFSVMYACLLRRLKTDETATWVALGRPGMLTLSPRSQWAVWLYLWNREYATSKNADLAKLGAQVRTVLLATYAIAGFLSAALVVNLVRQG